MAVTEAKMLFGKVMHGRLLPKRNRFLYGIYYLMLPLARMDSLPMAYNRFGLLSFYDRDHGDCDGLPLEPWARNILHNHQIPEADGEIVLICMPRVLNYVFNPVSFWLCYSKSKELIAVLCEVHNTFGERHTYVCVHEDRRVITSQDTLAGQKVFHVSPMLKRAGHYQFQFHFAEDKLNIAIDFYNAEHKKQLVTTLGGKMTAMNTQSLRRAFWQYPLVTAKATTLIHWQALKLLVKGIKYVAKPQQNTEKTSVANQLTEK